MERSGWSLSWFIQSGEEVGCGKIAITCRPLFVIGIGSASNGPRTAAHAGAAHAQPQLPQMEHAMTVASRRQPKSRASNKRETQTPNNFHA
jgi:hypothetical protein